AACDSGGVRAWPVRLSYTRATPVSVAVSSFRPSGLKQAARLSLASCLISRRRVLFSTSQTVATLLEVVSRRAPSELKIRAVTLSGCDIGPPKSWPLAAFQI